MNELSVAVKTLRRSSGRIDMISGLEKYFRVVCRARLPRRRVDGINRITLVHTHTHIYIKSIDCRDVEQMNGRVLGYVNERPSFLIPSVFFLLLLPSGPFV